MEECANELAKKLVLTEKESVGVCVSRDNTRGTFGNGQLCLVGKILAERLFAAEVVLEMMKKAWQTRGTLTIKAVGENVFFFQFGNRLDLLKAKAGGPWHVDRNALILTEFDGRLSVGEFEFKRTRIWVRIYELPLSCLTVECAKLLGNTIGRFVEWDKGPGDVVWGSYMRIRVEIDVSQPLMRGLMLSVEGRSEKWVSFKFEKLPYYCYKCGIIGHRFRDCLLHLADDYDSDSECLPYPKSLEVHFERKRRGSEGFFSGGDDKHSSETDSDARGGRQLNEKSTPLSKQNIEAGLEERLQTRGNELGKSGLIQNLNMCMAGSKELGRLGEVQNSKMSMAGGGSHDNNGKSLNQSKSLGLNESAQIMGIPDPVIEEVVNVEGADLLIQDSTVGILSDKGKGVVNVGLAQSEDRLVDVSISIDKFAGLSKEKGSKWTRIKRTKSKETVEHLGPAHGKRKSADSERLKKKKSLRDVTFSEFSNVEGEQQGLDLWNLSNVCPAEAAVQPRGGD